MWTGPSEAAGEVVSAVTGGVRPLDEQGFMVPKAKAHPAVRMSADHDLVAERVLLSLAEDQRKLNSDYMQMFGKEVLSSLEESAKQSGPEVEVQSASEDESTDEEKVERLVHNRSSSSAYMRGPATLADETMVWRHVKYGTFHLGKLDSPDTLACGRATADRYSVLPFGEPVSLPRCRVCFGSSDHVAAN
jgi:hypothetical protein